ncbi:MAG: hypothetical protein JO086_18000 [Acidimicrobiia bacterium]|nr:hypothetical protein [Acidimicrobiia bacterium]
MAESVEEQVRKVVDDAVARRDRTLPRWALARLTRLLRELPAAERLALVERVCERREVPGTLRDDLEAAAERADAPAPPPRPPSPPPAAPAARASRPATRAPRSAPARTRTTHTRTFTPRTLDDIPAGTEVEYLGRSAVIEPPWLILDDGRKFKFLNAAAVYVNGGVEVDGWEVWTVADGRSLAACHATSEWPPPDAS